MISGFLTYISILFLLVASLSCAEKQPETFSFVQLCDTQLGMGGYEHDIQTFKQAVRQINKLETDFVVICGDLVHDASDSSYTDFKNILNGLDVTSHLVSGNHDVANIPTDTTLDYYRKTIGEDYYHFEHKNHSFVVTNTQLWKVEVANESEKHHAWFEETLKKQGERQHPVFVLGHYPLYTELPDEEDHYYNLPLPARKRILELFIENNVVAYLSGHTHKLTMNNYEHIQLVSGETTSKNFDDRPLGFRVWQVSTDSITNKFVPLELATADSIRSSSSN
ncbi:MAG: metallophosphoesterase [Cyclobacterium sp.]|uniref:metallophosphoesterase n=1 Tax=unclassified Cyclobacterium TaxID=2615055 RepID=UPI0013D1A33B|nr:metallophosphoesterase [Cyclobacterium sp. SYSU L10401]